MSYFCKACQKWSEAPSTIGAACPYCGMKMVLAYDMNLRIVAKENAERIKKTLKGKETDGEDSRD